MAKMTPLPRHKGDRYRVVAPGWHTETFMGVKIVYMYRGDRGWMIRSPFQVGAFRRLEASKNSARRCVYESLHEALATPAIASVVAAIVTEEEAA